MSAAESEGSGGGAAIPRLVPLSPAQRGIWFLDKAGSGGAYNIARARRLRGRLDIALLEEAHRFVVARHEILRTRYIEVDGVPFQTIDPPGSVDFEVITLGEQDLDHYLEQEAERSFDLANDRMWRVRIVRLGEDENVLLDVVHHIAADGWSLPRLRSETSTYYRVARAGEKSDLPPALQYRDIAAQTGSDQGAGLSTRLDYWERTLDGVTYLSSPVSDSHGGAFASSEGFWVRSTVPGLTENTLERLAGEVDATPTMIGLSVFAASLASYARTNDLVIGVPVTGRTDVSIEGVVGPFFNSLPIRLRIEPEMSFRDLVGQTRAQLLDALDHEVPFDEIVRAIDPPRKPGQTPIFNAMFQHRDAAFREGYEFPGIVEDSHELTGRTAKFDLLLENAGRDEGLELSLNLRADRYDAPTGQSLVEGIAELARQVIAAPDRPLRASSMTSAPVQARVMAQLADNDRPLPPVTNLADHYEQQVIRRESEVAIRGDIVITHGELISASREIESELRSCGVTAGSVVALVCGRSPVMIAAILAVNRLGAVYVPIDPDYPEERIRRITEISGAMVRLAPEHGPVWSEVSVQPLEGPHHTYDPVDNVVYIMFTSGSTGAPKGVVVAKDAIVRLVCSPDYVALGPGDVVAHLSNVAFDAATFEIWAPLLNKATIAIIAPATVLSPEGLQQELTRCSVTTVFVTTALFNLIARERPGLFSGVREVLFGGERCDPTAVRSVVEAGPPSRLVHVYGPTETTTFASWYEVPLDRPVPDPVPIGGPIANTKLYVLDGWGRPVPPSLVGELHIGGPGVAVGYAGDRVETQARFSADPFSDDPWGRMYRTGDLVRVNGDGDVVFIGRADRQIKLRGFRIELGEIEAALRSHPSVGDAVVRLVEEDDPRLVAWVTINGAPLRDAELREHVSSLLPGFMVPAIVVVQSIPIGPTGKIDTAGLPKADPETNRSGIASKTELRVIDLFEEVLGIDGVGRSDDFFDLGGHSIKAVELVALIEKRLELRLGVMEMMEGPTPADIAARIDTGDLGNLERRLITMAESAGDPLFVFHHPSGTVQAYSDLVRSLPEGVGVIGVNASGVDGTIHPSEDLVEMAQEYASLLMTANSAGRFQLIGHSLGGLLAWETARQLIAAGRKVTFLGLIDTQLPRHFDASTDTQSRPETIRAMARASYRRLHRIAGDIRWGSKRLWHEMRDRPLPADLARTGLLRASTKAFDSYRPIPVDIDVVYYLATGTAGSDGGRLQPGWAALCPALDVIRVPGMHSGPDSILKPPNVALLAQEVAVRLTAEAGMPQ